MKSKKNYVYDPLMRIKSITAKDPGQNILMDYQYTYDKMDNIVNKDTEHGGYPYTYDDLYRLTNAESPTLDLESYTYDGVGNRITASDTTGDWSYNDNDELLGYENVSFEYDANGNLTYGTNETNYFYKIEDRLVRVEDGTGTVIAEYYYDPFGRRLWKEVGGVRTYFLYSDEGLIGEYDSSSQEIKTYGYSLSSAWTTDPLFIKEGGEYFFYQNDHLGTPQKVTSVNGAVVWSVRYSSFGKATVEVETVENNLRFPGQYYDQETGLYYNYSRYYDSRTGRYMRADPIGLKVRDINLYVYVRNNPINQVDPFGLYTCIYSIGNHLMYCYPHNSDNPLFENDKFVAGNNLSALCGDCQDNPERTDVKNHGAIPTGLFIIGPKHPDPSSRRDLTPFPGNEKYMFGRSGFQIHGCGDPDDCSMGCIAATTNKVRDRLNYILSLEEGDNYLIVIVGAYNVK